jgi:hypothetical protein
MPTPADLLCPGPAARRLVAPGSFCRLTDGMGIDATTPFGYESDFLCPVYPAGNVSPDDFFSRKDIDKAKSRMAGWVHSLARSGR